MNYRFIGGPKTIIRLGPQCNCSTLTQTLPTHISESITAFDASLIQAGGCLALHIDLANLFSHFTRHAQRCRCVCVSVSETRRERQGELYTTVLLGTAGRKSIVNSCAAIT